MDSTRQPPTSDGHGAGRTPPCEHVDVALELASADLAPLSVRFLRLNLTRLGRYLINARGIDDLRDATSEDIEAWMRAANPDGSPPALRTLHNRRGAVRAAFRALHEHGLVDHDPTAQIELPSRGNLPRACRPLTDEEVAQGRAAAVASERAIQRPASWALAEATATSFEIGQCQATDLDLDSGTVWLRGSKSTQPREAMLTDWGITTLRRVSKGLEPSTRIAYRGDGDAAVAQVSAARALAATMSRAGFYHDDRATSASLRAWAGVRIFRQTQQIEQVALALGCQSLDTTADIIAYSWQDTP